MEKESSEMSLDDVLSSIKKMVIDEEPPVLELTEMVSEDGSIVSLKKQAGSPDSSEKKSTDMSAFLKLIQQEDTQNSLNVSSSANKKQSGVIVDSDVLEPKPSSRKHSENNSVGSSSKLSADYNNTIFQEIIMDAAKPLIQDWIHNNLEQIVKAVVQSEVRNFLNKKRK